MDTNLAGRVVVVTAGGDGIGLAIVEAFLSEGAKVVTADLDTSRLDGRGGVTAARLDLLDSDGPNQLVAAAVDEHGRIDVVVNSLGALHDRASGFTDITDDEWRWSFDVCLMGMVRTSRAAIPHLLAGGGGAIVSIGSDVARQPDPRFVDYAAAKAAVVSVSKSLSLAYAPHIRSNVVSPGPTQTRAVEAWLAAGPAEEWGLTIEEAGHHYASEIKRMPNGRLGRPEEIANAVVFLASDLALQVTGSEYCVNGGILMAA